MGEIVQFGLGVGLDTQQARGWTVIKADLRQLPVRPVTAGKGGVQILEILHQHAQHPVMAMIGRIDGAFQAGLAGLHQAVAQVIKIIPIGHVTGEDAGLQSWCRVAGVLHGDQAAVLVAVLAVRGQVLGVQHALTVTIQIAEFSAQLGAAIGHQARRDSGVTIRRDIPVPRQAGLYAGLSGCTDSREQQSGLAFIRERETDIRGVQDRHLLEADLRIACHPAAGLVVKVDLVGGQLPVAVARWAGGVADVLEALVVDPVQLQQTGLAPGVLCRQAIGDLVQRAAFLLGLQQGTLAGDHQVRAGEADTFNGLNLAGLLAIGELAGLYLMAAVADDCIAAQGKHPVLRGVDRVGAQVNDVFPGHVGVDISRLVGWWTLCPAVIALFGSDCRWHGSRGGRLWFPAGCQLPGEEDWRGAVIW